MSHVPFFLCFAPSLAPPPEERFEAKRELARHNSEPVSDRPRGRSLNEARSARRARGKSAPWPRRNSPATHRGSGLRATESVRKASSQKEVRGKGVPRWNEEIGSFV